MTLITYFGPPGTGKTTELLHLVESRLASGIRPNQICYTTFTRKAAEEARTRAAAKFGLDPVQDLRTFSTLHSLAFRSLGLSRSDVFGAKSYAQVALACGNLQVSQGGDFDESTGLWSGALPGDKCIFIEQLARSKMIPIDDVCRAVEFDKYDARLWANTLALWKRRHHLVDFTDMLERAVAGNAIPPFRVLIVDEAQDLSPLQWELVRKMARSAEEVVLAGDDDQTIHEWAGASTEEFLRISRRGDVAVLGESHRLPRNVYDAAQRILGRIKVRQPKDWEPAREGGIAQTVPSFEDTLPNLTPENGSWYCLARNRLFLNQFKGYFFAKGLPYLCNGKSSLDRPEVRAARIWTTLQRGGAVSADDVRLLYGRLRGNMVDRGHRKPALRDEEFGMGDLKGSFGLLETEAKWDRALDMDPAVEQYIRMVQRNGHKLTVEPWITVSTIHQVKGGEADNVFLDTNMTRRPWDALIGRDPDSEHRVFYVGATRAKKSLYVALKTSAYGYHPFAHKGVEI